MVNIMARPSISQPTRDEFGEPEAFDAIPRGENLVTVMGGTQPPLGPSTCIFWCAVALGALVKGHPIESVRSSIPIVDHVETLFPLQATILYIFLE